MRAAAIALLVVLALCGAASAQPRGPPTPGPPPPAQECTLALTQVVNRTMKGGSMVQAYQNADKTFNGTAPVYPSMSLAKVTLAPCGVRVMHTHNNVDEMLYVVSGSVSVYAIYPTGSVCEQEVLKAGQAFLYPRGLVHGAANPSCTETAQVLGFFTAFDSATVNIAAAANNAPYGPFNQYTAPQSVGSVANASDSTTLHYDAKCLTRCNLGPLGGQTPA